MQSYIRNANLWMKTYEREIREYKEIKLYETIRIKERAIAEKIGAKRYEIMDR